MPDTPQLTIEGREEHCTAPEAPAPVPAAHDRLFTAPTTIRGQLVLEGRAAMTALHYDGAARPITRDEAERIAAAEYASRGCGMLSAGSDGGMHWRGNAYSPGAARGWAEEKARALVRKIMAGECTHTVFYDRFRDTFYSG